MHLNNNKLLVFIVMFIFMVNNVAYAAFDIGGVLNGVVEGAGDVVKNTLGNSTGQNNQTSSNSEGSETNAGATVGGCLAGLLTVFAAKNAIKKMAKGNKQKEKQYLLGAALVGCSLLSKFTNSVYNKISEDAKKKMNEDMIKAANTGETITGIDPNNANIKYEISTEEKEYKKVISGQEKTCKVIRAVADDQSDKSEPETALVRHCLDVATGKYKPDPISA